MSDYDEEWYIKQRLWFRTKVRQIKRSVRLGATGFNQRRFLFADAFISAFKRYPRRMLKDNAF
jgi:hypothetical protein